MYIIIIVSVTAWFRVGSIYLYISFNLRIICNKHDNNNIYVIRQTRIFGVRAQKVAIRFILTADIYNTIIYSVYCRLCKG